MNIREISEVAKKFSAPEMKVTDIDGWIKELEARASSSNAHYRGEIDFRYKSDEEIPDPGFVGNVSGRTTWTTGRVIL